MNEEILKRVDALADKLGTTAEFLYSALVEDVMRRGLWLGVGGFVLCPILAYAGMRLMRWAIKDANRSEDASIVLFVSGSFLCIAALILFSHGIAYIGEFLAPNIEAMKILRGG